MSLAYLRTHSYYGFLESLLSPEDLALTAQEFGIHALALTDYQYLTGAIEFYEACLQAGVKPILGLEIDFSYHGHTGRIGFLAKDKEGWSNLSRLSSITLVDNRPIDCDTLYAHRAGLICILGGINGLFRELFFHTPAELKLSQHLLADLKTLFDQDCFFEIQRYANDPLKNEQAFIQITRQFDLPLVASQNIHYRDPKDHALFQTLSAIRQNKPIAQQLKKDRSSLPLHFPTRADFVTGFKIILKRSTTSLILLTAVILIYQLGKPTSQPFQHPMVCPNQIIFECALMMVLKGFITRSLQKSKHVSTTSLRSSPKWAMNRSF
jgi:DNA polymerase III alpha subunit